MPFHGKITLFSIWLHEEVVPSACHPSARVYDVQSDAEGDIQLHSASFKAARTDGVPVPLAVGLS
jgi:hypothetical protein